MTDLSIFAVPQLGLKLRELENHMHVENGILQTSTVPMTPLHLP
jgi:hypothetical protein